MTGEYLLRDFSGEKISPGDRIRVVGGWSDPAWCGQVIEIHPPEPPMLPVVKVRFENGDEEEFSGTPHHHWSSKGERVYDFDDLRLISS